MIEWIVKINTCFCNLFQSKPEVPTDVRNSKVRKSSGEIVLVIRIIASPKVGKDEVKKAQSDSWLYICTEECIRTMIGKHTNSFGLLLVFWKSTR